MTTCTRTLTAPPALAPLLARGALLSPLKRPRPGAPVPGTRLVLTGVRIDPGRLAAYERLCAFPTGRAALPLTYPHVLSFPLAMRLMAARAFPLPLLGLVHTSLEIDQHRDLTPADLGELSVHSTPLTPHRRGTEATLVTEARSPAGELLWSSRSTYLARHRTATAAPEESAAPAEGSAAAPLPARAAWRLADDLGRRYGAVSGDRNPIHLHRLTARALGFPRAIAHGMWTAARCLAEYGACGAVRVRVGFRAPVLLPAAVTYAAEGPRFALRRTPAEDGTGSTSRTDGAGGTRDRVHLTGEVLPLTAG